MTAIITDTLKKALIQHIYDDVNDSAQNYYIGIGRSRDWDSADAAPTAVNTVLEERNFRMSMQSIKTAEDITFCVPRNNWSSGTLYSGYDDNVSGHPATTYYVITENNEVYICLQQGKDATGSAVSSTVKPTGTTTTSFKTADGYVWKFLYTIGASDANKFLSANYMPVKLQGGTDSASSLTNIEQETIQNAAVLGQIGSFVVSNGGTGYTSAPTVTILGDGDSAQGVATISSGAVVKIDLDSSGAGVLLHGNGYQKANITLSGGGGVSAAARAVLAPQLGFGADPRDDLRSTGIMFNSKPNGIESGKFIVGNDFRQVALIKNPKIPTTDSDFASGVGMALRTLTLDTVSVPFTINKNILGGTSGAAGYLDDVDSSVLYYHQDDTTGYISFIEGETLTETDGSGSGVLDSAGVDVDSDAFGSADINILKGDIFYIENRAAIERSVSQTEDIKIIIQL